MTEARITDAKVQGTGFKSKVQRFGRFLSGMVMPNIGAFIAWGLITALFIATGWTPNEKLSSLVGPMITYLLPLLIAYTGGKMVYGVRGGVVGAIAAMGVIVGADIPMFMGAMIMGPFGGFVIKKFDGAFKSKVPAGFEMLVENFSAGILGAALAVLGYSVIGPVVLFLNNAIEAGANVIVDIGILPLVSIFVEPAKVLFLNNAINHGVLGPLGAQQVKEIGQSIFFLLETNPGPGLGILLAYWAYSKGSVKQSAPGAVIIHFLGGIHEIYFPYILMKPILLLAVIAGGASGVLTFTIFNAGLVATPSPGSIFALIAMTPKGGLLGVLAGVLVSVVVTFLIASIFIKSSKDEFLEENLDEAKAKTADLKGKKTLNRAEVEKIYFACDAGMGSSAMGATTLRNKLKKANIDIEVLHCSVDEIPQEAKLIVTHRGLTERARAKAPKAEHISIDNFLNAPEYDELVKRFS